MWHLYKQYSRLTSRTISRVKNILKMHKLYIIWTYFSNLIACSTVIIVIPTWIILPLFYLQSLSVCLDYEKLNSLWYKRKSWPLISKYRPKGLPTFPADLSISIRVALQQESSGLSCSQGSCSFGEVLQEQSDEEPRWSMEKITLWEENK